MTYREGQAVVTRYALSWSGGKDSTLALDRALRAGFDVAYLFNIYEGNSGRVRFHGVRAELIRTQAALLGIPLLQAPTHPHEFETVFLSLLAALGEAGITSIVFGNIHLADVRAWYEDRTRALGFEHVEPLWGASPSYLLREFVARGYQSRIVSIELQRARPEWLGRDVDADLIAAIEAHGIDPCGEYGEYHSFTFGGPRFARAVAFRGGDLFEMEGHRLLDLVPA